MLKLIRQVFLYFPLIFTQFVYAGSNVHYLFNWNDGSGTNLTNWTWKTNISYVGDGWILKSDPVLGSSKIYAWGTGPRSMNKTDYGKYNSAIIDTQNRAPSTTTGGSLKVYETPKSTDHRSTWWVWYDGEPLSARGITSASTDRMSFYLKLNGTNKIDPSKELPNNNFDIGTYLCWPPVSGKTAYGTSDGCPYEGPGNQHYYHYLTINPGAWIHVLLDQHPQHLRNSFTLVPNNPSLVKSGKNYFAQMNQFYMQSGPGPGLTSFNLDELYFYNSKLKEEPNQNDISIDSLWVGYWPLTNSWELGFNDDSWSKTSNTSVSTFEIRWSYAPITNANYHLATVVTPLFFSGPNVVNGKNLLRRSSSWKTVVWTRFKLPSGSLGKSRRKIFFAVKDVSVLGAHAGLKYPFAKGDGHNAPSSYIKVIDYYASNPIVTMTGSKVK